jgi:outer membrane protein OmpA-like peptidoglycan-associated protein
MRLACFAFAAGALLLAASGARAQVTTNDKALQALKPEPAPPSPAASAAAPPPAASHATPHRAAVRSAHAKAKPAPLPPVPGSPPPIPVLVPPPPVLPGHVRPPPPPIPIKPDAVGTVAQLGEGLRITFGPGSSDINPAMDQALLDVAAKAKSDPAAIITITAWAPGTKEDPSTPRRLSLDRALNARAILINAGIVSERIDAVAKGASDIGNLPADRMDITVARPRSTPPATAPAPAK